MNKRFTGIIAMIMVLATCFSIPAAAGSYSNTKNKISITIGASAWTNAAASYALCNSATSTCAVISAYTASGTRVGYDIDYGTTDAQAETAPSKTCATAKGSSSATISGTTKTGPSGTVDFD